MSRWVLYGALLTASVIVRPDRYPGKRMVLFRQLLGCDIGAGVYARRPIGCRLSSFAPVCDVNTEAANKACSWWHRTLRDISGEPSYGGQ